MSRLEERRQGIHEETKLKLALDTAQTQKFLQNPLIRKLARGPAAREELLSTYYDTPDHVLRSRGLALRIRQQGNRRVQTIKRQANGPAGLPQIQEFETEIEGDEPRLDLIDDQELRASLSPTRLAKGLHPVFTTRIARRRLRLRWIDSDIGLALDRGEIAADGHSVPLCEIELELQLGRPARILELALLLYDSLPLRLEDRTETQRGYALRDGLDVGAVRSQWSKLHAAMTVGQALAAITASCLTHMQANEAAVIAGEDPEGVHQMRVAVRRLRAVLSVFGKAVEAHALGYLKEELRWLQNALGPARDWDVFIASTLAGLRKRLPKEPALAQLQTQALRERELAYEAARSALSDRRYTGLVLHLRYWLADGDWLRVAQPDEPTAGEQPIVDFAERLLERRYRKLHKLGSRAAELSEEELHKLRLQAKKMRYSAEFFQGLFRKRPAKRFIRRLIAVQDDLGALNDAVTGRRLTDELALAGAAETSARSYHDKAAGLVLGWQSARIEQQIAELPKVWEHLNRAPRFWSG